MNKNFGLDSLWKPTKHWEMQHGDHSGLVRCFFFDARLKLYIFGKIKYIIFFYSLLTVMLLQYQIMSGRFSTNFRYY